VAKSDKAAVSGTLEIRLNRYTPDFDRKTVEAALKEGGYPRFLLALRNAPEVGQLLLGESEPFSIRYAREKVEAGGRYDRRGDRQAVYFIRGGGAGGGKPRAGYEVAVVQIQLDGKGQGSGTLAAAARVRPDGDGGVLLDDYAEAPITLTTLTRKPFRPQLSTSDMRTTFSRPRARIRARVAGLAIISLLGPSIAPLIAAQTPAPSTQKPAAPTQKPAASTQKPAASGAAVTEPDGGWPRAYTAPSGATIVCLPAASGELGRTETRDAVRGRFLHRKRARRNPRSVRSRWSPRRSVPWTSGW
jgi:hypothetical protein